MLFFLYITYKDSSSGMNQAISMNSNWFPLEWQKTKVHKDYYKILKVKVSKSVTESLRH